MSEQDLLCTDDYELHHRFYFTLVISVSITVLTWLVLLYLNPLYSVIRGFIYNYYMYYPFLLITVLNNIYQVYAHVFTGIKFMGFKQIVPPGSSDNQSLAIFTISNIFDILGWLTVYIYYGKTTPFLAILASAHYGSGIVAIFFNQTFQKYYIGVPFRRRNKKDRFGYWYWRLFRVSFVFTDAITRGWISYLIILDSLR